MTDWTDADMTDQTGRTALVTGATSGLGLRIAEVLAAHGARVLISSRDPERGAKALARVTAAATGPAPQVVGLDLLSLESVASAAGEVRELTSDRLDLLVSNAGIMAVPLELSLDGYESQWATNVIGMAALTAQLLPAIRNVPGSRIATMTSLAHHAGGFDTADVERELDGSDYQRVRTYCRTKLADLVFARELERRLRASGAQTMSVAAHPGVARSQIARDFVQDRPTWVGDAAVAVYNAAAAPTESAAWSMLFALTFPRMRAGYLIGPRGPFATRGRPTGWAGSALSRDREFAASVWRILEEHTPLAEALPRH